MEPVTALMAALFSLLGVVLGAFLHHVFADKNKHVEMIRQLRTQAYADFISAASQLFTARRVGITDDSVEIIARLNDAKTRICVYGHKSVLTELSAFWKHGATLEKEHEILAFSRLCGRIRESEGMVGLKVGEVDLPALLFRLEPANYSYRASRDGNSRVVNDMDPPSA